MKTCDDFPGRCCESCHEDMDMGIEDVPLEVYSKEELYAKVCCAKVDYAECEVLENEN